MGATKLLIRFAACLLPAFSLLNLACDKTKDKVEQAKAAVESKPPATQEAKPTTQQLLSGTYKRIRLPSTPLSVMAPDSWKIDAVGPVTFLTGPTMFGTATIGLSSPGAVSFKQSEIDALVAKLAEDSATHPEQFRREEHRKIGGVHVIEKRYLGKPMTRDKLDEKGDPIPDDKNGFVTVTATPVQWTVTVFVPGDQDFARYELNFIDLDQDQLAVDEKLLDKIIGSVTVDGAGPARGPTTAQ